MFFNRAGGGLRFHLNKLRGIFGHLQILEGFLGNNWGFLLDFWSIVRLEELLCVPGDGSTLHVLLEFPLTEKSVSQTFTMFGDMANSVILQVLLRVVTNNSHQRRRFVYFVH